MPDLLPPLARALAEDANVSDELRGAGIAFGTLVERTGAAVAATQLQLDTSSAATASALAATLVNVIAVREQVFRDDGTLDHVTNHVRPLPLISFIDPVFYQWTSVRLQGVRGKTLLTETSPGKYEGVHRIAANDRVAANTRATATLRSGNRTVTSQLGQSLLASSAVVRPGRLCANCGVVEAVNVVEVKGPGSYLGLIAGGVAGAVLGSQVGKGSGKTAAQVLGAAGGAYAGREIEKNVRKTKVYEVVTRLEGGGTQTISYETDPGYKVGDRVRVEGGALVRN